MKMLALSLPSVLGQSLSDLDFDVLGPFPRGSRETADPLEAFGGILGIARGDVSTYPSEMVDGGYIGWESYTSNENGTLALDYTRGCTERVGASHTRLLYYTLSFSPPCCSPPPVREKVSPCVRLDFLGSGFPGAAARMGQVRLSRNRIAELQ
jgi:hypothetical protein